MPWRLVWGAVQSNGARRGMCCCWDAGCNMSVGWERLRLRLLVTVKGTTPCPAGRKAEIPPKVWGGAGIPRLCNLESVARLFVGMRSPFATLLRRLWLGHRGRARLVHVLARRLQTIPGLVDDLTLPQGADRRGRRRLWVLGLVYGPVGVFRTPFGQSVLDELTRLCSLQEAEAPVYPSKGRREP